MERTITIQICDRLESGSYQEIREALPTISIVRVIHIATEESSLKEAIAVVPQVDAILLDSGDLSLSVKQLGGTGRIHDWSISSKIRDRVNVPVFSSRWAKTRKCCFSCQPSWFFWTRYL